MHLGDMSYTTYWKSTTPSVGKQAKFSIKWTIHHPSKIAHASSIYCRGQQLPLFDIVDNPPLESNL